MALKELLGCRPSGYEISGLNSLADETRQRFRRRAAATTIVSAGSRNGQAGSLCSPECEILRLAQDDRRDVRCHFIRSNVFCKSCKSEALPIFSRVLSIHFFSSAFFVGRSFW